MRLMTTEGATVGGGLLSVSKHSTRRWDDVGCTIPFQREVAWGGDSAVSIDLIESQHTAHIIPGFLERGNSMGFLDG